MEKSIYRGRPSTIKVIIKIIIIAVNNSCLGIGLVIGFGVRGLGIGLGFTVIDRVYIGAVVIL